jgi:signal transduction histidine kinase
MKIGNVMNLFNRKRRPLDRLKGAPPETFYGELNRWCNIIVLPLAFLITVSWPIYIELDKALYNRGLIVEAMRWGLTAVGLITFILWLFPFFRKRGYWLVMFMMGYLALATGYIVGMVSADPIYMGGFSIVVIVLALMPIRRVHAWSLVLLSLLMFKIVGEVYGMKFVMAGETYGLYNLVISVAIAVIGIFVFDMIREHSYNNSRGVWITSAELKKANQLKNQLLQIAAHDLKDPLQVIIGYTDLLKMRLRSDRFVSEKLKIVHRSTDRMIKLIAGLLEITNIESGQLTLHKSEVDLVKVVDASVKSFNTDTQKKNQKVLYSADRSLIVDGDEMMLRQVANHLISNAIKFSPPGRTIWVSVEQSDKADIAVLEVKDEGPGLQKEEVEKVFGKFQQLSTRPTGGEISTGLGLAITRDLVSRHGGSITVASEPSQGCTFIVTLPLFKGESETGDLTAEPAETGETMGVNREPNRSDA